MNKRILGALLGILAGSLAPIAHADDGWAADSTHMLLDAGIGAGGDKIATAIFTDGSTKSLYAGNGVFADFGVQHDFSSDWSLKATLGFDIDTIAAKNANISFTRVPLDVLAIYSAGNSHFGFGVTEHFSPQLDMDGLGPDADFSNATGLILQYQYWLFGIRYTNIKYKVSSISIPGGSSGSCIANCSFDGSSIGVFFNYVF
jgi:hypothetical protein